MMFKNIKTNTLSYTKTNGQNVVSECHCRSFIQQPLYCNNEINVVIRKQTNLYTTILTRQFLNSNSSCIGNSFKSPSIRQQDLFSLIFTAVNRLHGSSTTLKEMPGFWETPALNLWQKQKATKQDNTGKFKRLLRLSCSIDSRANKPKNCARAALNDFAGVVLSLWTWFTFTRSRNETKSSSELRFRQRNILEATVLVTFENFGTTKMSHTPRI